MLHAMMQWHLAVISMKCVIVTVNTFQMLVAQMKTESEVPFILNGEV